MELYVLANLERSHLQRVVALLGEELGKWIILESVLPNRVPLIESGTMHVLLLEVKGHAAREHYCGFQIVAKGNAVVRPDLSRPVEEEGCPVKSVSCDAERQGVRSGRRLTDPGFCCGALTRDSFLNLRAEEDPILLQIGVGDQLHRFEV